MNLRIATENEVIAEAHDVDEYEAQELAENALTIGSYAGDSAITLTFSQHPLPPFVPASGPDAGTAPARKQSAASGSRRKKPVS